MTSSVVRSSSIKFVYEDKNDNYWKFYTSRTEHLHEHGDRKHRDRDCDDHHEHHHRHHECKKLFLEMKVFVPDVGLVTQKFEVTRQMAKELTGWLTGTAEK